MENPNFVCLINLDRRPDRLQAMKKRLIGVNFNKISAVDGQNLDAPLHDLKSTLSAAQKACIASHIKALKLFLKTEKKICCILEDDIIFGEKFKSLINNPINFPPKTYVIKLDTFMHDILISRFFKRFHGLKLYKMFNFHISTAAYVTDREGAKLLIKQLELYDLPADLIIFKKMLIEKSYGKAYQLNPAICRQEHYDDRDNHSDISSSNACLNMKPISNACLNIEPLDGNYETNTSPGFCNNDTKIELKGRKSIEQNIEPLDGNYETNTSPEFCNNDTKIELKGRKSIEQKIFREAIRILLQIMNIVKKLIRETKRIILKISNFSKKVFIFITKKDAIIEYDNN